MYTPETWLTEIDTLCSEAKRVFTALMGQIEKFDPNVDTDVLLATALVKLAKLDSEINELCSKK